VIYASQVGTLARSAIDHHAGFDVGEEVMRCACRRFLWLMIAALLFIPSPGISNDAPLWLMSGGAAPKSGNTTIRMDSEEVTIQLNKDSYTVDAIFHFFNTGETTTEWVGFPKRGAGYSDMFSGTKDFIRFKTWVKGLEVQFWEERALLDGLRLFLRRMTQDHIRDYRWMVKQVVFPGLSETTTRVRYEAPYDRRDAWAAYYIYGTGSYWKDNIGKATFTVDGGDVLKAEHIAVRDRPALEATRKLISESLVQYELHDFKPHPEAVLTTAVNPVFIKKNDAEGIGVHRDVIDRPKLRWGEGGGKDVAPTQASEAEKPSSDP